MQRHRNPANGYRSSPIGIGGGGGGGGGPGYRSYSRGGFGRGQPPPPRRIDVFMEAGKLAAEYLISKGMLPPNSINGRWQNSNLKNQISGGGVGDGVSDSVSGTGSVRRRFPDDYSTATGSRDGIRARRTIESLKSPAVELNRDVNRSSLVSEKVKVSSDKQRDDDSYSGSMEEQRNLKDGGPEDRKSVSGDLDSKSYDTGNIDTSVTNQQNESPGENADIKTPISEERVDTLKNINAVTDDVAMDDDNHEPENPVIKEDPPEEDNNNNNSSNNNNKSPNNNSSDLLALIRFNKIPTRTRSSMTLKGSKSDPVLISGDENQNKQDGENQTSNHEPELKIEQVPSEEDHRYEFGQGLHTRSLSFPQRSSSIADQELSEGHHAYTRSSSALLNEKRPLHVNDNITESAKKPRSDDYLHASSSRDGPSSQESQPCNSYAEEKQFFPSSFKICDLNSMEASGVHDNHDTNSVIGFSSLSQPKQEPVSVDFDLTMNSSCDITDRHGKGVEVIDLDCEDMQEDDDNDNNINNNNSDRREEAIFTDLESFPESMRRVSDMPQESYGLMISELLNADIPNSSVSTGVNPMHNELSLPNEEGMLGDDESIYMSLGEIPISMPKL